MTTYNKIEFNGHIYEIRTNVGTEPRCWRDGIKISYQMYMSDLYDVINERSSK